MNAIKKHLRRQLLKLADGIYGKYGIRIDPTKLEVHKLDILEVRGMAKYPVRYSDLQMALYVERAKDNIAYQIALECEKRGLIEFYIEREPLGLIETIVGSLSVYKMKPSDPISVLQTPKTTI